MAKHIVVEFQGEVSSFAFAKIDREKLYGKKARVVVDELGRACSSAWLTADGSALVLAGGTAHVYVDDTWNAFEPEERRAIDLEGNALEPKPSTLGVTQMLSPSSADRLLDCTTSSVYQLDPESLGDELRAALGRGELFEAPFRYRDGGTSSETMFLLANDEGVFALVGVATGFAPIERELVASMDLTQGEDELEGDLDFSMM